MTPDRERTYLLRAGVLLLLAQLVWQQWQYQHQDRLHEELQIASERLRVIESHLALMAEIAERGQ